MDKANQVEWTLEERAELHELFTRVARGNTTIGTESGLPRLCSLLNFDMTYSVLETTLKLYEPRMNFDDFLTFWACRPESGKMNTGKQPIWRWGSKNPTGSAPQSSMFGWE